MMRLTYFYHWAILFSLLFPSSIAAQGIEGGLLLGFNNYIGDFVPARFNLSETHTSYGIFLRKQLHKKVSVRFNILTGKISGNDYNYTIYEQRGYNFETTFLESSVQVEWNLFVKNFRNQAGDVVKTFHPYIFAGIGAGSFEPVLAGMAVNAPDYQTNFQQVQAVFPLGLGFQWQYANGMSLSFEAGARATTTDYLDGVSLMGNANNNDWYAFGGITLGFLLGK